jgi:hypothetical protein
MKPDIDKVNSKLANLEFLFGHTGIKIITFDAPLEAELRICLLEIFHQIDLSQNQFTKLRSQLGAVYRSARQLLSTPESAQIVWSGYATSISLELEILKQYLEEKHTEIFQQLDKILLDLAEAGVCGLGDTIQGLLDSNEITLIPEQRNITQSYREWIEAREYNSNISVISSVQDYVKHGDFTRSLVLATAPRSFSSVNLRTLIYGGISPEVVFVCPNWWLGDSLNQIKNLFPGQPDEPDFDLRVIGPEYILNNLGANQEGILELTGESVPAGVENFEAGGTIPCRLLLLSSDLALPVEQDADSISTLIQLEDGSFKVKRVDPFGELSIGDTIFELSSSAESDFLWNLAAEQLGEDFHKYAEVRKQWLSNLRDLKRAKGWLGIQNELASVGVTTASHLLDWLNDPKFTRPRLTSDFEKLLRYVGLTETEIADALKYTKLFRSKLSSLGQKARESMSEVVTAEEWEAIQAGNVRMIKLDEFGDAEFQLALYKGISNEIQMCSASQIRKVVRVATNG